MNVQLAAYVKHKGDIPVEDRGTPDMELTLQLRQECYVARRAIRNTNPKWLAQWVRTKRAPVEQAQRIERLVELLRPLLLQECVAKAESLAIEQYLKEQNDVAV